MQKNKSIASYLFALISALFVLCVYSAAQAFGVQATSVGNEAALRAALQNGDQAIRLSADFDLAAPINLTNYSGVIYGDGHRLHASQNMPSMFVLSGGALEFQNISLDGDAKARQLKLYNNAAVVLSEHSALKNGNSVNDAEHAEGGSVFMQNSKLTVRNSSIVGSQTRPNAALSSNSSPHGGALYGYNSQIVLDTVEVSNNLVADGTGHGGAIYIDGSGSNLEIFGSDFSANRFHTKHISTGAAIYAGNGSRVTIDKNAADKKTTFNISGPFNTGGALRLLGAEATIANTDFVISASNGNAYATSGGAIATEGSSLTISKSNFSFENGTANNAKLEFAGGFITVVGGIKKFDISDSSFSGRGIENHQSAATYGGAICFESTPDSSNYTSGTASIKNTTFTNFHSDAWGGTIALSTKVNEHNAVKLIMTDCKISQTGTLFWGNQYGGAIAVGPGNTLVLSKTSIEGGKANRGGGIYNQGSTTLQDASRVASCLGYSLGGGIYNDGELTVDEATLQGNTRGDWSTGPYHPESTSGAPELPGTNIYAAKDVVITPKAVFDDKDVRVLDGQSKIVLTGPLTKTVYVSISEVDKASEQMHRYVGYVIASGRDYSPSRDDAYYLHYAGKNPTQPYATPNTNTQTGVWDAVLNPKTKEVVIGQRMTVFFHANPNGQDDATKATVKTPTGQHVAVYDTPIEIYSSEIRPMDVKPETIRPGYALVGWYNRAVNDADVAADSSRDLNEDIVFGEGEITKIIDPNLIHIYAGWENRMKITKTVSSVGTPSNVSSPDKILVYEALASELDDAQIEGQDAVYYEGLEPNHEYILVTVINKLDNGVATPVNTWIRPKFTVTDKDGSGMIHSSYVLSSRSNIEFDTTYVVYEYLFDASAATTLATNENSKGLEEADRALLLAAHEDPSDKAQTFMLKEVKEIKPVMVEIKAKKLLEGRDFKPSDEFTFVIEGAGEYTVMPEKTSVNTKDSSIVSFGNATYTAAGNYIYTIREVKGSIPNINYTAQDVTLTVTVTMDENQNLEASLAYSSNTPEANFTNTYPRVKTLVSAADVAATPATGGAEAQAVKARPGNSLIKDKINYVDLAANTDYVVKSELVDLSDNSSVVLTKYQEFATTAKDGEITLELGQYFLKPGHNYVVFESLIQKAEADKVGEGSLAVYVAKQGREWLEHKDETDLAQTIKVDELSPVVATVVTAGEVTALPARDNVAAQPAKLKAAKVLISDKLTYTDLLPETDYVVKSELVDLSGNSSVVLTKYHQFTATAAGAGEYVANLGEFDLQGGHNYVVFESVIPAVDADQTGAGEDVVWTPKAGKVWTEHKDASDQAQTIVVEVAPAPDPDPDPQPTPDPDPNPTPDPQPDPDPDPRPDPQPDPDPDPTPEPEPEKPRVLQESSPETVVPKTGEAGSLVATISATGLMLVSSSAFAPRIKRK